MLNSISHLYNLDNASEYIFITFFSNIFIYIIKFNLIISGYRTIKKR